MTLISLCQFFTCHFGFLTHKSSFDHTRHHVSLVIRRFVNRGIYPPYTSARASTHDLEFLLSVHALAIHFDAPKYLARSFKHCTVAAYHVYRLMSSLMSSCSCQQAMPHHISPCRHQCHVCPHQLHVSIHTTSSVTNQIYELTYTNLDIAGHCLTMDRWLLNKSKKNFQKAYLAYFFHLDSDFRPYFFILSSEIA